MYRRSSSVVVAALSLCAFAATGARALGVNSVPARITVQPLFLVPYGWASDPTDDDKNTLYQHLLWAQSRYQQMLGNRDTFAIHDIPRVIHDSNPTHTNSFYAADNGGEIAEAALAYMGLYDRGVPYNRYNNPYIYVVVAWGTEGGTWSAPLNGGINSGGAITKLAYYDTWTAMKSGGFDGFQSTLQHELGHAFGLAHSWKSGYGGNPNYSECNGLSVMSYNTLHWTSGMIPASFLYSGGRTSTDCTVPAAGWGVDAILTPEDINNLAMNKRVFPNLYFDPEVDIPAGWTIQRDGAFLGALLFPGDSTFWSSAFASANNLYSWVPDVGYDYTGDASPDWVSVTSNSNTLGGWAGSVVNPLVRDVKEGYDGNTTGYDWYVSPPSNGNGFVDATVAFPNSIAVNGVAIHTGFASGALAANWASIYNADTNQFLWSGPIGVDDTISFSTTLASKILVYLQAPAGYLIVRGLRFFTPDGEIYPHKHPEHSLHLPVITTAAGNEQFSSKVTHVVGPTIPADNPATGYQASTMWHSGPVNSSGWTSLTVQFPYSVTLSSVEVHSQHSGLYHQASQVQVEYLDPNSNQFTYVTRRSTGTDDSVSFGALKARTWKIDFYSTDGYVTIRALRFHTPNGASIYFDTPDGVVSP